MKTQYIKLESIVANPKNVNPNDYSVAKLKSLIIMRDEQGNTKYGFDLQKGTIKVHFDPETGLYTGLCGNSRITFAKQVMSASPALYQKIFGKKDTYPCVVYEGLTAQEQEDIMSDTFDNKTITDYHKWYEAARICKRETTPYLWFLKNPECWLSLLTQQDTRAELRSEWEKFLANADDHDMANFKKIANDKLKGKFQEAGFWFCGAEELQDLLWCKSYPQDKESKGITDIMIKNAGRPQIKEIAQEFNKAKGVKTSKYWDLWNALKIEKTKVKKARFITMSEYQTAIARAVSNPDLSMILNKLIIQPDENAGEKANQFVEGLLDLMEPPALPSAPELPDVEVTDEELELLEGIG